MTRILMLDTLAAALDQGEHKTIFGRSGTMLGKKWILLAATRHTPGLEPVAATGSTGNLPTLAFSREKGWICQLQDGSAVVAEIVPWSCDYQARTAGILDPTVLGRARVGIVGVSSLGLPIGILLAKSGVGSVTLVDPEDVALENLVRTQFAPEHVGVPKVAAAAELLVRANPLVEVKQIQAELHEAMKRDPPALEGLDLIIASASNAVGFELAARCHLRTPMLFPAAHARAASAELFVSLGPREPGAACFSCYRARIRLSEATARSWNYDAASGELQAEPGLGSDLAHLTAITASIAIRILAGAPEEALPPQKRLLLMSHKAGALLEEPFITLWAKVPRDAECPYHAERAEQDRDSSVSVPTTLSDISSERSS